LESIQLHSPWSSYSPPAARKRRRGRREREIRQLMRGLRITEGQKGKEWARVGSDRANIKSKNRQNNEKKK
jgi:hypothetical protein